VRRQYEKVVVVAERLQTIVDAPMAIVPRELSRIAQESNFYQSRYHAAIPVGQRISYAYS
jgi:hypothetical protein